MMRTGQFYSSGEWLVREGSEEDFVERWTTLIEWSLNNASGAESFVLVRSTEDSRRFLSLGAWENQEEQESWRGMPRMQELLSQGRELCEGVRVPPVHVSGLSEPVKLLSCSGRAYPTQRYQPHGGHSKPPGPSSCCPCSRTSGKSGLLGSERYEEAEWYHGRGASASAHMQRS
jgi:heme-degrading monooxygenase HmoA